MALRWVIAMVVGYALGALPMGFIWIKLIKRQDITKIGSGRTGGTNAMRAGGFLLGLLTAVSDLLKGFMAAYLASLLVPGQIWASVLAGVAGVAGHNWSLWLYWWRGKLSAGAGTGPNIGAAIFFWPAILLFMVPWILFMVMVVGYASLASITAGLLLLIAFYVRYLNLGTPWEYAIYGLLTSALIVIALRANIQRLLQGTENRVGIFAKKALKRSEPT